MALCRRSSRETERWTQTHLYYLRLLASELVYGRFEEKEERQRQTDGQIARQTEINREEGETDKQIQRKIDRDRENSTKKK